MSLLSPAFADSRLVRSRVRPLPLGPVPLTPLTGSNRSRPFAAHARHHSCVFLLQHRPRQPVAAVLSLIMVRMLVATRNRISELEGPRRTKQHVALQMQHAARLQRTE